MKHHAPIYRFGKQLQTRAAEDYGKPDEFRIFQNARVRDGLLTRRPGKARVVVAGTDGAALNFDGSADYLTVPIPTGGGVWLLGLRWSLKMLIKQDDNPAGNEYLLGMAGGGNTPVTVHLTSSRILTATLYDSAGSSVALTSSTALTAGTSHSVLVTRDTNTCKLWINNTAEDTDTTFSATLSMRTPASSFQVGATNSGSFFDGDIDFLTLYSTVLADNADGFLRLADPYARDVLAHYTMEKDANEYVEDHSRFGNTALAVSAPISATGLSVRDAVGQGMTGWLDRNGKRRILAAMGGRIYAPEAV
jgi:hypothetical protein